MIQRSVIPANYAGPDGSSGRGTACLYRLVRRVVGSSPASGMGVVFVLVKVIVTKPVNISRVERPILENRCITFTELEAATGLARITLHRTVHENLKLGKVSARSATTAVTLYAEHYPDRRCPSPRTIANIYTSCRRGIISETVVGSPSGICLVLHEDQLPFLDVLVKKRSDGSLGHSVFRKSTHTKRYLHASSHHHPGVKRSVIKTLTERAHRICDSDNLRAELQLLHKTFKNNGYDNNIIRQSTYKNSRPEAHEQDPELMNMKQKAFLSYIEGTTDRIGKLLRKFNIKTTPTGLDHVGPSRCQKENLRPILRNEKPGLHMYAAPPPPSSGHRARYQGYDGWINFENEMQDRQEWRNAICEREGKDSGFSYDLLDRARTTFGGMVLRDQPGEYCRRNGRTYYEHVVVSAPK
ncbi:hypothetical protein ANN_06544 [Periplaneta americana]|uniref:Helix-turn-helix domain-containing protein n=1 Tax=Periplaneta americana TaxID=6978 RepID=A0ABQ8TDU8_PERAM|nr:hypothetical protein ANN_06544 [Periplaneta americana]